MSFGKKSGKFRVAPFLITRFHIAKFFNKIRFRKNTAREQNADWIALQAHRNRIIAWFQKKFHREILQLKEEISQRELPHVHSKKIWVYWAQGIENAPDIVKVCVQSIYEHLGNRYEIVLLSDKTYREYVSFPQYIEEKYQKGMIGRALFADLLRTELLIEHGGTWMDATIFCSWDRVPSYMLESDLFLFQTTFVESWCVPTKIENYFISAASNHPILMLCQGLLYQYWKKYNREIEYLFYYEIFTVAAEAYREKWDNVVHYPRADTLVLSNELHKPYDKDKFEDILSRYPFHKLTYRWPGGEGSYFDYIVKNYKKYGE